MFFFLSYDKPFAVKADGVRKEGRVLSLSPEKSPLLELCPLDGSYPVYCLLCEDFFARPPENVIAADLGGAWFLRFRTPPNAGFQVLAQKNFGDAIVTLYRENGLKLSLETREDFFAEAIPLTADGAKIAKEKDLVAVHFKAKESFLAVYGVSPKISRVFFGRADEYALKHGAFTTTIRHRDFAKHVEKTEYAVADGGVTARRKETFASEAFSGRTLPDRLIPYAFFESVLTHGETDRYLADNMLSNKDRIREFLGAFVGVFPPPRELEREGVGLLYRDEAAENKYYARYFGVSQKNGKIDNLFPIP